MKLLNIDSNAKTVKGQAHGYMTAVLYLAPWKAAGVNLCPAAELAACGYDCLNTAGRGGMAPGNARFAPYGLELPDNAIQRARIARTRLFAENRDAFMAQLVREIEAFVRKAARRGLVPVVRLNGTSDIRWELIPVGDKPNIFAVFPEVQFYDYTKLPGRTRRALPANYHLSVSYSAVGGAYSRQAMEAFRDGAALVIVTGSDRARDEAARLAAQYGRELVDGDEHDLRFLDPAGAVIVLKAKGAARKSQSGFVLR